MIKLAVCGYFHLSIVATGCPSERRPQKTVKVITGGSAVIQDETTESFAWFFNVLGVQHRHTGPRFGVSSERQLIIVILTSPGIEPTTSSFQVERSIQLSYASVSSHLKFSLVSLQDKGSAN